MSFDAPGGAQTVGYDAVILARSWQGSDTGLPAPSNGTFYSYLGFQNLWDTSRAQPGDAGIITKPGLTDAKSALDAFRADLPKMSQEMAASLDPNAVTSWFWALYPYRLGSYARCQSGPIHTLLDVARLSSRSRDVCNLRASTRVASFSAL
jgi:hypothetical protein